MEWGLKVEYGGTRGVQGGVGRKERGGAGNHKHSALQSSPPQDLYMLCFTHIRLVVEYLPGLPKDTNKKGQDYRGQSSLKGQQLQS